MRKNKGYTLLELLVANTLGLMVLAGVVQVFSANSQSIRVLNANSNVQEGGRIALELLSRDIRMADFWGCMPDPASILNHLDTTDPDYDADIHSPDTSAGIDGENNVGTLTIDGITVRPGTDVLYLRGVAPNPDVKIEPPYMPTASADIKINTGVTTLPKGALILITNCNGGDFFTNTATNTETGSQVLHATGNVTATGAVNNATKPLSQIYKGDALISTLVSKSIFVGANTRGGWSLYRYDQQNDDMMELVPNVADLQFKYGENNGTDDSVDQYGDAGDATINMDNVIAIHTTLVMASADQTVFTSSGSPAPLQREYSATTTIRNRLLR